MRVWSKPLREIEGYHEMAVGRHHDCDHGPCTAYEIEALGLTVFVYDDAPSLLSFHLEEVAA